MTDTQRRDTIILILASAALVAVICSRCNGLRLAGRPAVADQEHMLASADDWIVGDSNTLTNPVSRSSLANTRWGPLPGMPSLRQASRGGPVPRVAIHNEEHANG